MKRTGIICLDLAIIAGEIVGMVISIGKHGWLGQFAYYTQCSNYLLFIATAAHLFFLLRGRMPAAVERGKYYATCLTSVTFLVTVFILIPWYGHPEFFLFRSNGLFHHLLCPIMAVAGLPFLSGVRRKDAPLAMIPTVIYGTVMYTLNFLRLYDGPYPFLKVHSQPWYMSILWFVVIAGVAYGVAVGLGRICEKKK